MKYEAYFTPCVKERLRCATLDNTAEDYFGTWLANADASQVRVVDAGCTSSDELVHVEAGHASTVQPLAF